MGVVLELILFDATSLVCIMFRNLIQKKPGIEVHKKKVFYLGFSQEISSRFSMKTWKSNTLLNELDR